MGGNDQTSAVTEVGVGRPEVGVGETGQTSNVIELGVDETDPKRGDRGMRGWN